jgi:hypothetical protein
MQFWKGSKARSSFSEEKEAKRLLCLLPALATGQLGGEGRQQE